MEGEKIFDSGGDCARGIGGGNCETHTWLRRAFKREFDGFTGGRDEAWGRDMGGGGGWGRRLSEGSHGEGVEACEEGLNVHFIGRGDGRTGGRGFLKC